MTIQKACVLGAGTMGTGIAAHFANAGVPCLLLDIVPAGAGADPKGRSRLALEALERARKGSPPAFFTPAEAALVEPGNIDDHLARVAECDWIVEAVSENLEIKRDLFRKVARHRRPDAIVSSNTSGLSLSLLTEGLDDDFRRHFLITHFFNPPRYMYLLETVKGPETLSQVVEEVERFADVRLGKGVVRCKDTPNFIANRIGVFCMGASCRLMLQLGLTVEEVDEVTGPPMGRPKTASFRLHDLVGIDVAVMVMQNVRKLLPNDESRAEFEPPEFLLRMVREGKLGRKSGAGFYRKEKDGSISVLDLETFEYRPQRPAAFASLDAARKEKTLGGRLRALTSGDDRAAEYAWKLLSETLLYSARRVPEISDDIVSIDRALRWGFSWDLGPFEAWDAIGVAPSCERLRREGKTLPPLVEKVLASREKTFYSFLESQGGRRRSYFDLAAGRQAPVPERAGLILLDDVRERSQPLKSNDWASLRDIGDGVLCVEFHSKMNTISGETLAMIRAGIDEVERSGRAGLVVGNQAQHFSLGANLVGLSTAAKDRKFGEIDAMIRDFHATVLRMRYSTKPVVTAIQGMTLGGGCELALAAARVQAAAETATGLVELGVGLIPAGGGTRELACRSSEAVPEGVGADFFPWVRAYFEMVAQAKTSQCAAEARKLGLLREVDGISMNRDRALADAKRVVLHLADMGYRPPPRRTEVRVAGRPGIAELRVLLHQYREGRWASDYDVHVATSFASALCGGDVDPELPVTEEYLLDLEREVFLSLVGEAKTLERIAHTLKTGKPLRN
ncbi:MAG TPA: 3-hydroxyacyl-CoA dehydrogenase/enoyl-CoA hydratase family protein [Planctomycetota bacterium]|nr:3-hydroxyacyl-CoA dehydrogenase/enoyl-CoA hydratase family protein [Planctomycetota bacterium]